MFRIVRHWWGSGRGKITLRLFVFEFTVVTLGVLFAQVLQGFAEDRSAQVRMEQERSRSREELARVRLMAVEWLVAVPCLDHRMDDIMSGRLSPQEAALARPSLVSPRYSPPDDESLFLIQRRYGTLEKDTLAGLTTNVANIHDVTTKIIDHWGRLVLIDPAFGPISAEDRAQARIAAADIKAQLRSASIISNDANVRLRRISVGMARSDDLQHGPAHSCGAICENSAYGYMAVRPHRSATGRPLRAELIESCPDKCERVRDTANSGGMPPLALDASARLQRTNNHPIRNICLGSQLTA